VPFPQAYGFPQDLRLFLGILAFIAGLGGFIWLSRRVSGSRMLTGRRMKVIDRMMISRDSSILLVQIGSRLFAVASGKGVPSFISELSPSDFPEPEDKVISKPDGFLGRFVRNMKANASGADAETDTDVSFAEILKHIKDPPSGAEDAGDAGHTCLREEETPFPSRLRRPGYQVNIENMSRLGEPDNLDSRFQKRKEEREWGGFVPARLTRNKETREMGNSHTPVRPVPKEGRGERVDQVLEMIAKRRSEKDTGDMG
jgi:flagellar biogenesis protein FliO